ncbi:uncharacterized protein [Heterodontus francisci]|uniref:uncharacterized protein n=1 Tax=Heterodontus francisci TaxID=7792 RepID=UPI00355B3D31
MPLQILLILHFPLTPCRVFTIPSDLPPSETERSVLSKGLSFISLRTHLNEFHTRPDVELFFHRLHLFDHESFPRPADPFTYLQHSPSTWIPPTGLLPLLIFSLRTVGKTSAVSISLLPSLTLSPSELATLRSLRSNPDIVIKPADKGDAVVVWRTDLYLAEAECQLSDTFSYLPLDHDPTTEHQATVHRTVTDLSSFGDLPSTAFQPTLFGIFFTLLLSHAFKSSEGGIFLHTRSDGRLFNLARLRAKTKVRKVLIRELLFADDAALTSHTEECLQRLIDRIVAACNEFGLIISLKETNIMDVRNAPSINIGNHALKVVQEFTT